MKKKYGLAANKRNAGFCNSYNNCSHIATNIISCCLVYLCTKCANILYKICKTIAH